MTAGRYTTELAGRSVEVEISDRWLSSTAVLYVDGRAVAEGSESFEAIDLRHEDVRVRVKTPLSGAVDRCELVLTETPAGERIEHRVPLDPPPGTRAARLADFQRERPRLYAARHVAVGVGEVLLVVLGVGAVVRGLLPRIDLPPVDLSWVPDQIGWLFGLLPDIAMPAWLGPVMGTSKYWLPILIAGLVAANEVDKRRKANDAKRQRDGT